MLVCILHLTYALCLHSLNPDRPEFDSPTVFGRLLDKDKGGYFMISPKKGLNLTTKQQYLPSSNILQTRYLHEDGVLNLIDFFPRPNSKVTQPSGAAMASAGMGSMMPNVMRRQSIGSEGSLKKWLVRRVECIRGTIDVEVEVFPAFSKHEMTLFGGCLTNQDRLCSGQTHNGNCFDGGLLARRVESASNIFFRQTFSRTESYSRL